jgi:hypothetical protein
VLNGTGVRIMPGEIVDSRMRALQPIADDHRKAAHYLIGKKNSGFSMGPTSQTL